MEYCRPDDFDGTKENYSIWGKRMFIYLSSPAWRGTSAQEKTSIVLSYIRGPRAGHETQACGDEKQDGEGCQWDYGRFWEMLDERFADRLQAVKARCQIYALYMDQCSSAQEYFEKLEVYMHQAKWEKETPYTLSVISTHADQSLVDIIHESAASRTGGYRYWKEELVRLNLNRSKRPRGISQLAGMSKDPQASTGSEAGEEW
ncbi:hypothetical protein K474DRAFT_1609104 [Panus rudis PR-1116 ss-1]|nr:hypothetical protein K474DRAFT_1609104 [Panus rudis PR-1116 ss-1]